LRADFAAHAQFLPPPEVDEAIADLTIDLKTDDLEADDLETQDGSEEHTRPETAIKAPAAWSSAAAARDFLEQLAPSRPGSLARFLHERRGDLYLGIAVVFVAVVLSWGLWSSHSVGATGSPNTSATGHRKPADADLSWYDRMLIQMGLAEAPEPPESKGNPEIQVWVDIPTALYYCPGADLYGKTPKGKFTTQRDAQLDQFEPASRKVCN